MLQTIVLTYKLIKMFLIIPYIFENLLLGNIYNKGDKFKKKTEELFYNLWNFLIILRILFLAHKFNSNGVKNYDWLQKTLKNKYKIN